MNYKEMIEQARINKELTQLTAAYVKFDKPGVNVTGLLMGKNPVAGGLSDKSYNQYLFDTDDGLVKCALGSANDGEAGVLMEVGQVYSITFTGQEALAGGRRVNCFDVFAIGPEIETPVGGDDDKVPEEETPEKAAKKDKK